MQGSQTSKANFFYAFLIDFLHRSQPEKKPSVLLIKPSIAAKREREERDMGEERLWFSDRMAREVTGRLNRCPMLKKSAQRATCWC